MQLIQLSNTWTIIIDILAWGFIHVGISLAVLKIPQHFFEKKGLLLRLKSWERQGVFWRKYTYVDKWKKVIPDGAAWFKKGFRKKHLQQRGTSYLKVFILESRRAELTHWLSIPPAVLFFLWNPPWAGWIMIGYAFALNIPIIILQRTNRGRLEAIVKKRQLRE